MVISEKASKKGRRTVVRILKFLTICLKGLLSAPLATKAYLVIGIPPETIKREDHRFSKVIIVHPQH